MLNHPNIVPVYDAGSADDCHYMAMGYVNGQTLEEVLKGTQTLKEVDAINNAANKKTELQSAANVKYKRAMEIARQRAEESEGVVEEVQNERIKELIETNKENPEEIDRILSKEFGILIMDPKEK